MLVNYNQNTNFSRQVYFHRPRKIHENMTVHLLYGKIQVSSILYNFKFSKLTDIGKYNTIKRWYISFTYSIVLFVLQYRYIYFQIEIVLYQYSQFFLWNIYQSPHSTRVHNKVNNYLWNVCPNQLEYCTMLWKHTRSLHPICRVTELRRD